MSPDHPDRDPPATEAPPLQLAIVPVTPFQQNCSLLVCTRSGTAVAFDPGGDLDQIDDAQSDLTIPMILE